MDLDAHTVQTEEYGKGSMIWEQHIQNSQKNGIQRKMET